MTVTNISYLNDSYESGDIIRFQNVQEGTISDIDVPLNQSTPFTVNFTKQDDSLICLGLVKNNNNMMKRVAITFSCNL